MLPFLSFTANSAARGIPHIPNHRNSTTTKRSIEKEKIMSNVYEIITARIVHQLETGVAPWHKPWKARGKAALPRNLNSRCEYRGINLWILLSSGFTSPYWLTFKQARDLGGYIRKGEAGLPVVYWKFGIREVQDGDEIIEKPSVLCRYYRVFNLEQCEGVPTPAEDAISNPEISQNEACDEVINGWTSKPNIQHAGDRASYCKGLDCIRIPRLQDFDSAEEYYSTLFHELTHSTGHPARLNRSTLMESELFGDEQYSREELVAEMGAAFLCGFTGIENRTINNSSSYLQSWLDVLKADSRMVLIAASQGQKAVVLILGNSPLLNSTRFG
jgi:antirestriction protein ArdC